MTPVQALRPVLTQLVHGDSGVGKSWYAASGPQPVCVLDVEGRGRYLPYPNKVEWHPERGEKPPENDGTWTHCIVPVHQFQILDLAYQWFQSGQTPFRTIDLDSLMEVQKRFIDEQVGTGQLQQQDWGEVLRKLESLIRKYRDLTLLDSNSIDCVVITCGTKVTDTGRRAPLLQGALKDTLPYYMDAVGYIYVVYDAATNQMQRSMLVQPTNTVVAKDGTNMLGGPVVPTPNLTELFNRLSTTERTA